MLGLLGGLIDGSAGGTSSGGAWTTRPLILLLLGVAAFAATSGLLYVISLFLQQDLGRTPADTALGLIP